MKRIKLDQFLQTFNSISHVANEGEIRFPSFLDAFFKDYGGTVINAGLYRIHTKVSTVYWAKLIAEVFPAYPNPVVPAGFDWMGRQFAMDIVEGNMVAFCVEFWDYEPYSYGLEQFHNEFLVEEGDNILGIPSFELWKKREGGFEFDECLACKVSFFEGGANDWENVRREKTKEYWKRVLAIRKQTLKQSKGEMAPSGEN